MKNELILARYTGQKKRVAAERLLALLHEFGLDELAQTRFPALPSGLLESTAVSAAPSVPSVPTVTP